MKIIQEFKSFAMRGNVVDMATGIIIGAAFGGIVSSLVSDVLTPPLGALVGGIDFGNLSIKIPSPINPAKPVEILYGKFINTVFNFFIVVAALFMLIKAMNTLKRKEEAKAPAEREEIILLTEIRDLLRK